MTEGIFRELRLAGSGPDQVLYGVLVGGAGDTGELAAVEPDVQAGVAGVDDDVAGAGVEVRVHAEMAAGAACGALEIAAVGRGLDGRTAGVATDLVDGCFDGRHGDEEAAALGAKEDGDFGDGGFDEWEAADGAEEVGGVGLRGDEHAVVLRIGMEDGVAEVSLEAISIWLELDERTA